MSILFLSFTTVKYFSWAGITSLQGVSEANLYDACINSPYLIIKGAFPNSHSSTHILTKSQLEASVYVDGSNATLSPKSSNQIVVKQDVTPATFSSYYPHSCSTAYGTGAGACGSSYTNLTLFTSSNSAPIVGTVYYTNSGLSTTFNGGSQYFQVGYSTGVAYVVKIDGSGVVLEVYSSSCSPT